jgi:hypothetical protein
VELLVILVVVAIVLLIAIPFPIHAHGGTYPFEGVESADRADREARSRARAKDGAR